jgi:hypothetical protein
MRERILHGILLYTDRQLRDAIVTAKTFDELKYATQQYVAFLKELGDDHYSKDDGRPDGGNSPCD